jgi:hypothetical protein
VEKGGKTFPWPNGLEPNCGECYKSCQWLPEQEERYNRYRLAHMFGLSEDDKNDVGFLQDCLLLDAQNTRIDSLVITKHLSDILGAIHG